MGTNELFPPLERNTTKRLRPVNSPPSASAIGAFHLKTTRPKSSSLGIADKFCGGSGASLSGPFVRTCTGDERGPSLPASSEAVTA